MSFRGQLIKAGIDANGTDISIFNGTLTLQTTNKLLFRDTGIHLYSNADGYLTITADTGIVISSGTTGLSFSGQFTASTSAHFIAIGTIAAAKALTLTGTTYLTVTNITGGGDYYCVGHYGRYTTSAAMNAGGFYGNYQRAYINHDIQDVYMQMGKLDFSAGTTAISPGQLCATMSEIDLGGTGTITVATAGGIYGHLVLFPTVDGTERDITTGPIKGVSVVWLPIRNYSSEVMLFSGNYGDDRTVDYGYHLTGSGELVNGLYIKGGGNGSITNAINIAATDATNTMTNGILIAAAATAAIKITGTQLGVTNTTSAAFQYGSYGTAIAYGARSTKLVVSSIHISSAPAVYVMGSVVRFTSTGASAGYWCGVYAYSDIQHDMSAIYTIRGRMDIDGSCALGQSTCAYLQMNIGATAAITEGTGPSISGVFIDMAIGTGAAIHTNIETSGIQIYANGLTATVDGPTYGLFIVALGGNARLDYGINIVSGTNSLMTAAMRIAIPTGSDNCELPAGIEFDVDASGSQILHALKFTSGDKKDGAYTASTTITSSGTSQGVIKIDVGGTDRYVPYYDAGNISTSWTDQT